jgi:oligoribonuclease
MHKRRLPALISFYQGHLQKTGINLCSYPHRLLRSHFRMSQMNSFSVLETATEDSEECSSTALSALSSKSTKASAKRKDLDKAAASSTDGAHNRLKLRQPLVWIDLEMTGLDINKDTIIEIAVLVSDGDLLKMVEGPELVIHHEDEVLDNMNDWCKEHHGLSGLTQRVRDRT